jgi:hypothetical protein
VQVNLSAIRQPDVVNPAVSIGLDVVAAAQKIRTSRTPEAASWLLYRPMERDFLGFRFFD